MKKEDAEQLTFGERKVEDLAEHSVAFAKLRQYYPNARTVSDSPSTIGIMVTEEDIARAVPGNPAQCAVAVGACRQVPELRGALIGRTTALLVYNNYAVRYLVPKFTYARLFAFDAGGKVEPGMYLLSRVPKSASLIEMHRRTAIRDSHHRRQSQPQQKKIPRRKAKAGTADKHGSASSPRQVKTWWRNWGNTASIVSPENVA